MRTLLALLLLLAFAAVAHASTGAPEACSPFSRRVLQGGGEPELWLAQRAITREWGPSEDSTYHVVDVPGWKSEGGAFAASALLPGSGQLYLGEGSGWWFLVAEAGGWAGLVLFHRRADDLRDEAASFVGDPYDSSAVFSFARLEGQSDVDPARLQQLWAGDREAYYDALSRDPSLQAGFRTQGTAGFLGFTDRRDRSDKALRWSRFAQAAVWANHVVSAIDALRAARIHNIPLQRDLDVQLGARWNRKGPALRAALHRRF